MLTAALIAVIVLSNAAGDVLVTRGMKDAGEISTLQPRVLLPVARKLLRSGNFLAGVLSMGVGLCAFLVVLSWADLSFVFPSATSLIYVASTLGARFFLKETVTLQRWAGILIICGGVVLVSMP